MCNAGQTENDNIKNCQADIEEYFDGNTDRTTLSYVKFMYYEMTITDMGTYCAKLYFYNAFQKLKPYEYVESPLTMCSKKLSAPANRISRFFKMPKNNEYDECIKEMTSIGLNVDHDSLHHPTNYVKKNIKIFFLHHKIIDLGHKRDAQEYMKYMFKRIASYVFAKLPDDFCSRTFQKIIIQCKTDISKDIKSLNSDISRAKTAMINIKKKDMKTKYGKLFYIDIRDRIQGVEGGYQRIVQYCNDQGDKAIECKNELSKAGYKETFDYQSFLIHTYYNIALGIPFKLTIERNRVIVVKNVFEDNLSSNDLPAFLEDFVLIVASNFQLKKLPDERIDFCESMVRRKLNLDVIMTLPPLDDDIDDDL